jgi:uncharacterized protein (DUF1330 family)
MSAFLIADVHLIDPKAYAESGYLAAVPGIAAKFGGVYRARAGTTEVMEGEYVPERLVIIEFPDLERALAFYGSAEYAPWREVRQSLANSNIVITEGLAEPMPV